jgi:uncharacterized protein (TIGR03905 family)
MHYTYKTKGVCSQKISFDIEDGIVKNVQFLGGCNGNTQGVSRLAEGRPAKEVVSILKGIHCGPRPTSCPDQLATAIDEALKQSV